MSVEQSENEHLKSKFDRLTEQLMHSEKLASLGQLAAGVAHEINNPIGYVASNLGSLKEYIDSLIKLIREGSVQLPADQVTALKKKYDFDYIVQDLPQLLVQSEAGLQRVIEIIGDLKDFSYLEEAEFIEADLHSGIRSTLNIIANELKYKAELKLNFADLPRIQCIPSQINQVLLNLLMNAAQAIKGHGVITVTTGYDEHWVWFSVADTGAGIPAEKIEEIYQPFYTTKPKGQGTGLGLVLSRSIVDKHTGVLEVTSELGVGSCFTVKLPRN
ncbi:ATP-binding protein [Aliidiomarina quisquiliarum]|uniref:ATP-binding protein n=1 Tax=Aliidiomarina quisquiliarum TaxID=2938947 RepID=UPI00208F6401|nr:ATP-binding protein [Aliidiomarina quisquiliarum]MCO4321389.1 ATP-binding protein [Aliidiomarina quisquiliarum]